MTFAQQILTFLVVASVLGLSEEKDTLPLPVATVDLTTLLSKCTRNTLAFISEDAIAIGCYPGNGPSQGAIVTFRWGAGQLRLSATRDLALDRAPFNPELYGVARGSLLSFLTVTPEFLTADLKLKEALPNGLLKAPVQQANLVAQWQPNGAWRLYRLVPTIELVRAGMGEILSFSDEFVVYRADHKVHIETIDGTHAGMFNEPPRSTCHVGILGRNRLFLACADRSIVDFNGKEVFKIPLQGWGFRVGSSKNGERLSFDTYTRTISSTQRISEFIESLFSLGMGPNIEANGEAVHVIDTRTGGKCFDLQSPKHLLGLAGEYHADISPSGRFVAVLAAQKLSLYELPGSCPAK
jgi:hypothetical protein